MRPSIREIKIAAQDRLEDVLAGLGIHATPSAAGYISMCNPVKPDRTPSFTIWTRGGVAGAFKDHRDDRDKGDIIDLVAYCSGWFDGPKKGRDKALAWLAARTGLDRYDDTKRAHVVQLAVRARQHDQGQAERDEARRRRAFATWLKAIPILGTRADTYLRTCRGIDIEQLEKGPRGGDRTPGVLRYFEAHRHTESGRTLPCMVAGMIDMRGKICAIHRTWLKPNGSDKADVDPPRKIWPGFAGLVIPIWRGADNLSVKDAIGNGIREVLCLTEGIEDALTLALVRPDLRIWAAGSLANIGNVVLPECIDGVIVHKQNDWHSPAAMKQFERVMQRLEDQGRPVAELKAFAGKDINDTLRGAR